MLLISSWFALLFTLSVEEMVYKSPGLKTCVVLFVVSRI